MPSTAATVSAKPTGKPPSKLAILNRYTTLPILLDILHKKHIMLLSPETWEDRNDAYYLERYRLKSKFRSVPGHLFLTASRDLPSLARIFQWILWRLH